LSYGKNYAMANVVLYIFAGIGPWLVGVAHVYTNSYTLGLSGLVFSQIIVAIMISRPITLFKTNP
jgi:cyanate permease